MRNALIFSFILLMLAALGWLIIQGTPPRKSPMPTVISVATTPPPVTAPKPVLPPAQYEAAIGPAMPPLQPLHGAAGNAGGAPKVAIVIDDCGISAAQTTPAINLPPEVTLTFLPYGLATRAMAQQAEARGHDVFLHMPMQPIGHDNPGPEALMPGLDPEVARSRVIAALARVPGAIGMNNHMGSAATADLPLMHAIMPVLAGRHLLFLDSYTSAKSIAYQAAQQAGVASARRDIFLDDTITPEAIARQLQSLEKRAKKQGYAIAIGHPHPETMTALARWIAEAPGKGITLARAKDFMRDPVNEGNAQ